MFGGGAIEAVFYSDVYIMELTKDTVVSEGAVSLIILCEVQ